VGRSRYVRRGDHVFFFIRLTRATRWTLCWATSGTIQREIDQLRQQISTSISHWRSTLVLSQRRRPRATWVFYVEQSVVDLLAERLPATIEMTDRGFARQPDCRRTIGILSRPAEFAPGPASHGRAFWYLYAGVLAGALFLILLCLCCNCSGCRRRPAELRDPFRRSDGLLCARQHPTGNMPALKDSMLHSFCHRDIGPGVARSLLVSCGRSMLEVLRSAISSWRCPRELPSGTWFSITPCATPPSHDHRRWTTKWVLSWVQHDRRNRL